MQPTQEDFAKTYQGCSDHEIASLFAQSNALTEKARSALWAEIARRLDSAELARLHSRELHREANFDRRERKRRKATASYLFFRNDPRGTIVAIVIFIVFVVISELVAHHR